jgi:hypothetical protein
MKSNQTKNFKVKSALRKYRHGGGINCMADGGDILSRGMQRTDDAIEAMSRGDAAPSSNPSIRSTLENHPVNPSLAGGYPTDATPVLDRIFETAIKLGFRAGGPVKGPGGPTADKIPAMLSAGEYVLPADTVKAVGKQNLDSLRVKTHRFVGPRPGMADGGDLDLLQQAAVSPSRAASFATNAGAAADQMSFGLGSAVEFMPRAFQQDARTSADASSAMQRGAMLDASKQAAGGLRRMLGMANGGEAMYMPEDRFPIPQGWTGEPSLRFMAGGGVVYPGLEGIDVNELRIPRINDPAPFPGPEGIQVSEGPALSARDAELDSTIGERARAAKTARMAGEADSLGARVASGAADAARGVGSTLRSLPGRALSTGRNLIGRAAVPLAGAFGAYENLQRDPTVAGELGGSTGSGTDTAGRLASTLTSGVSAATLGAMSPEDMRASAQAAASGQTITPNPEQQGWGTRAVNDLLGRNAPGGSPLFNPTLEDVQASGGLRSRAAPSLPPSSDGEAGGAPVPQGTAVFNGRTVSPDEIARLAQRNIVSGDNFSHPGIGTLGGAEMDFGGMGARGTDRSDDNGGVFHMPTRNPSDEINSRFDALEKKIGPVGNSAARLRALAGLGESRARALEGLAGQSSQERVADKGLQATIAQRGFDRKLDMAKFGIQQAQLDRQLAHDNTTLGLEQAKYRDGLRKSIASEQLPGVYKGLDAFKSELDDKGELNAKGQAHAAQLNNMIMTTLSAHGLDMADLPPSMLTKIAAEAGRARDLNEAQKGVFGLVRNLVLGGERATTEQIGNATPTSRERGAIADKYVDALGRKQTVASRLRGGFNPLNPVNVDAIPDFER